MSIRQKYVFIGKTLRLDFIYFVPLFAATSLKRKLLFSKDSIPKLATSLYLLHLNSIFYVFLLSDC